MQQELRLRKREDFGRVYRHGQSTANLKFVLYYMRNFRTQHFHLGVSVSKKVGSAVVRNRIRRLVKEAARLHAGKIKPNMDLIIIAKKAAVDMTYEECLKNLLHILNKAQILVQDTGR